jgi:hypothetical protein
MEIGQEFMVAAAGKPFQVFRRARLGRLAVPHSPNIQIFGGWSAAEFR